MDKKIKKTKKSAKAKKLKITSVIKKESAELKNAKIVLKHAENSVNEFYEIFQKSRKGSKGSTTHAHQDLLRAMLVFACSGIDAVLKQLVKDALPTVIKKEVGAQKEFQKFIERRMKKGSLEEKEKLALDINWIAAIFASSDPQEHLIDELQKNLTGDSLQSRDQLLKVAAHFAITKDDILDAPDMTKKAFDVRNEVIHEMDTSLGGQKKRRQRAAKEMVKYSENILSVGSKFINTVNKKLYGTTS